MRQKDIVRIVERLKDSDLGPTLAKMDTGNQQLCMVREDDS